MSAAFSAFTIVKLALAQLLIGIIECAVEVGLLLYKDPFSHLLLLLLLGVAHTEQP